MRKTLSLICFCLFLTAPLVAADIGGAWLLEMETPQGTRSWTMNLTSNGTTLTGHIQAEWRERKTEIAEGKIDGDEFSFTSMLPRPNGEVKLFWTGTVEGTTLTGTIKTEESEPRDFTATKK